MPPLITDHKEWMFLAQASIQVAAAFSANVNTYKLAYSGTWATAAQNPANWPTPPSDRAPQITTAGSRRVDKAGNQGRFRFLVADTENDTIEVTLWGKDAGGAPYLLCTVDLTAGAAACSYDPITKNALTNFFYADTIVIAKNNVLAERYQAETDGIAELRLDLLGQPSIFADFKCDGGGGTAGTDGIVHWKYL